MIIKAGDRVLFQGDSITDTHRDRVADTLGTGYAYIVASLFSSLYPEKKVHFVNRGISGNQIHDLEARWDEDCLDLKPDVLSIMIGINDCWRRYSRNLHTTTESFRDSYQRLLTRTRENLKDTKLILLDPFVVPALPGQEAWREDLDPKIQVVRDLAREFGAVYVPLDGLFGAACARREPAYWAPDGVHPSPAGHGLIARAWLDAAGVSLSDL
ncbi:MAG TPA: SGNH/GDSL hydrolase family protein [Firmicutes bacterium]|jgi:lysophospholipase L1-like esterase|nr:SGNH/GDSL hydrolase family protein [Bacillota bacterium]